MTFRPLARVPALSAPVAWSGPPDTGRLRKAEATRFKAHWDDSRTLTLFAAPEGAPSTFGTAGRF